MSVSQIGTSRGSGWNVKTPPPAIAWGGFLRYFLEALGSISICNGSGSFSRFLIAAMCCSVSSIAAFCRSSLRARFARMFV